MYGKSEKKIITKHEYERKTHGIHILFVHDDFSMLFQTFDVFVWNNYFYDYFMLRFDERETESFVQRVLGLVFVHSFFSGLIFMDLTNENKENLSFGIFFHVILLKCHWSTNNNQPK